MKPKWIFRILAGLVICSVFSFSQGADKFYYGGFHVQNLFDTPDTYRRCRELRDSLRFNMVLGINLNEYVDSLASASLQGIPEQADVNSPTQWSRNSHYTLWEAEGFPGSRKGFSYSGGTQVCDPEAHPYPCGEPFWNAMKFYNPSDSGIVQTGPDYRQYGLSPIPYLVNFNLKFSGNRSIPTKPVCNILVVADGSTIQESTLVVGDFPESGYGEFQLQYTLPDFKNTQFKIYWHGVDSLYVDYVEVGNQYGYDLMSGQNDQYIIDYVQQSWVDTSVVYRWYMKDQPQSIDCYLPYAHIDSILRDSLPLVPGAQFTCYFGDTNQIHDYLIRTDPVEYMVDAYPFGEECTTESNIQQSMNWLTDNYNYNKRKAQSVNKDFWVAVQAHIAAYAKGEDPCKEWEGEIIHNDSIFCTGLKDPTPNEVRLQTFLALCYGANGVFYYKISIWDTPGCWETGLYDQTADTTTEKWEEIINFTGPRVEKLGPLIVNLTWQGAGFYENVDTVTGSFIDSLKPAPGETLLTTYVEVGFFEDDADTDYFMLVNRQCLENHEQNVTVYMDSAQIGYDKKMWYVIDQYSQDTTFTGAINGIIPFTTHLAPGEGKLFKLAASPDSAFHGYAHPLTWQGGIMVDIDVTVDSGKILVILDSNCSSQ